MMKWNEPEDQVNLGWSQTLLNLKEMQTQKREQNM
jgi:hypothetical protein